MELKKIGIKNFRVFKDYTEFDLKPITLLTGPNNSGKSSFTKLLLLLQNSVTKLEFQLGKHNLENFDSVRSWHSDEEEILISFDCNLNILPNNFVTEICYKEGIVTGVNIRSKESSLIKTSFTRHTNSDLGFQNYDARQDLNLNIEYLIDLILSKNICVRSFEKDAGGKTKGQYVRLNGIDRSADKTRTLNLIKLKPLYDEVYKKGGFGQLDLIRNLALHNEIDGLGDNRLIFNVKAGGIDISREYAEEIRHLQREAFSNIETSILPGPDLGPDEPFALVKAMLNQVYPQVIQKFQEFFQQELNYSEVTIENSALGKLIFEEKTFDDAIEEAEYFQSSIFDQFRKISFGYKREFRDLHYLSANRGKQNRILHNSSDNDMDEIVLQFSKLKDPNLDYLKEVLDILEIEGELFIERFQNYISVIYLKNGDKTISLADMGYGYSQVLPIALKILTEAEKNDLKVGGFKIPFPSTFILEEPEANLHPNLQSKLADIILVSLKHYPEIKFILETHSEYLIRKLQFLTAKKELSPEQSVIYYFNADKYVSREEPKVKKIEITSTGNLTDTFGPGFYDEATRLKFDLMKINKEQSN